MLKFLWQCLKTYQRAKTEPHRLVYFTLSKYGTPETTVLIASGREAWRVSDFVTNFLVERRGIGFKAPR
jgi:hypothetical protein